MIHILLHIIYIFCFVVIRSSCKSEDSPNIVVIVSLIVVVHVDVATIEVHVHGVVTIVLRRGPKLMLSVMSLLVVPFTTTTPVDNPFSKKKPVPSAKS